MTKTQIAKAAAKRAEYILRNEPARTFNSILLENPEEMGDAYAVTTAVYDILMAKRDAFRALATKLEADCAAIDRDLWDECCALENMGTEVTDDSIDFAAEFYRHSCNVVACHAENKSLDINARLGYGIY